jgi:glycosyltransferase involved in cell wall biosynthesis
MKICILGKYPPIEGGVSTHTYWLARGLARRGHHVHVVTNADEVEDMYRMNLVADDARWLEGSLDHGGAVHLHNPEAFSRAAMGHIPESNPFVSKLASVATDVIRQHGCEIILAYYYEPYGVAGWLASQWTGAPLLLKHAGSDLDRLMRQPDLSTTYKEILRRADAVVTQPRLMARFAGMGVSRERLREDVAYGLPPEVFAPEGPTLDLRGLAFRIDGTTGPREPMSSVRSASALVNPAWPTIGILGKTGQSKGTYDLIDALGRLAAEGLAFNFVAMVGQPQAQLLAAAVARARLTERCTILPLLPNWRVPEFLRSCTAVCFLERGFPVEIHGPMIAREVLACGTCLVVSGEIASKQRYRDALVDGKNVLVVEDPRAIDSLALTLRRVIQDPAGARAIGAHGAAVTEARGDYERYIEQWELLLAPFAQRASTAAPKAEPPLSGSSSADPVKEPIHPTVVLQRLSDTLPDVVAYLRVRHPAIIDAHLSQAAPAESAEPVEDARRLCAFAEQALTLQDSAAHRALISALRYARARLNATHAPQQDAPPFALADALRGRTVDLATVGALHPLRGHAVRVETFDHEVSALFCLATLFGQPVQGAEAVDAALAAAPERATHVLFQRTANLAPCELQLDAATEALVAACDGTRDTRTVLAVVADHLGLPPALHESAQKAMLSALAGLHRAGAIAFAEPREGGGWVGGSRSPMAPAAPAAPAVPAENADGAGHTATAAS